jgi:hypothetical protein
MQEESNRIVNNMEQNRRAEIEQRRETLQAIRENAAYEQNAADRNFRIQQQNLQVQAVQSQLDARTQETQAGLNIRQAEMIFGGLATFSQAAGKISEKIEVDRKQKEVNSQYISSSLGLDSEQTIERRNVELALREQGEIYNTQVMVQGAQGGDPNAVGKALFANPAHTYISNRSSATYLLENQFPRYLDNFLNNNEIQFEYKGRVVAPSMARQDPSLMQTIGQVAKIEFLKAKGLWGLDDKMLMDGLKSADAYIKSQETLASRTELENINSMRLDQADSIVANDPTRLVENGVTAFRMYQSVVGNAKALEKVEGWSTLMGEQGFLFPLEQIGNLDLKGNGRTFAEEFPVRWARMKENRVNAEMRQAQRELAIDDLSYQTDLKRVMEGLTADPSQVNADAAAEFFRTNYGKVPGEILKYQSSYTTEALEKVEAAKRFLAIPPGLLTLEAVEAAEATDTETGRELRRRLVEQEARYSTGIYKETAEAFKTTANGVTAYGTNKPNTPASVFLQAQMRAVFRKRVDEAVAGGMDFNQAATTIGQQLDAEVKAGAREPTSPWYRKTDAPGGAPSFPNLNKGMLSNVETANRRYSALKQNIATNGLGRVIDTKNSIITAEEAAEIVKSYGKPGFTIPQDVRAVAGMSNGLDPLVIINRQLAQHGIKPLQPPPSLSSTEQTVNPAFKKLLYKTPSIDRSMRALGSANSFNAAIVPNNLGPVIQQAAQASGVNPSFIAALAEIESRFDPNSTSYNGSSFGVMQINRAAHPQFFAQNDWKNPQANINYGAQYYSGLLKRYGDPVAAAMAYNAGPGNYDAYLKGQLPDGRVKTEMLNHGKKFAKVMYKYGGGQQALSNQALLRNGSPMQVATPFRPLQSFAPTISSITFDTGQPGIDVFFEDKQFPAVLPGVVKDISSQGGPGSGYGNYVVIESVDPETNQKVDVLYAHLASTPNLRPGQMVRTGQIIGQQGGTGRVRSADGTIASIDFLRPAPRGSKDMTPYTYYDSLRRRIASQLRS